MPQFTLQGGCPYMAHRPCCKQATSLAKPWPMARSCMQTYYYSHNQFNITSLSISWVCRSLTPQPPCIIVQVLHLQQ